MRLPFERSKKRVERAVQFAFDNPFDLGSGKRVDPIEQLKKLEAVIRWQYVEPQRERLPQLDPHPAEFFQRGLRALGARRTTAAEQPGQHQVVDERTTDLPRPADGHGPRQAMVADARSGERTRLRGRSTRQH